jgi:hypothetical protein
MIWRSRRLMLESVPLFATLESPFRAPGRLVAPEPAC